MRAFNGFMNDHLDRLTRQPGGDLLSRLAAVQDGGDRATRAELLGAALARMEAEIALRDLFERFEHLTLAGPPSAGRRAPSTGTHTCRSPSADPPRELLG